MACSARTGSTRYGAVSLWSNVSRSTAEIGIVSAGYAPFARLGGVVSGRWDSCECLIVWLKRLVLRLRRAVVVVEDWEVLLQLVDELVGVDGLAHYDETVNQ